MRWRVCRPSKESDVNYAVTFSAEESVLLAALRTVTTGQPMPPLPPVAWHDVLVLAQGHKQTPALAYALRNHPDRNRVPEQIWANINTITRQRRIRNAVMTEDFLTATCVVTGRYSVACA